MGLRAELMDSQVGLSMGAWAEQNTIVCMEIKDEECTCIRHWEGPSMGAWVHRP